MVACDAFETFAGKPLAVRGPSVDVLEGGQAQVVFDVSACPEPDLMMAEFAMQILRHGKGIRTGSPLPEHDPGFLLRAGL